MVQEQRGQRANTAWGGGTPGGLPRLSSRPGPTPGEHAQQPDVALLPQGVSWASFRTRNSWEGRKPWTAAPGIGSVFPFAGLPPHQGAPRDRVLHPRGPAPGLT